MEKSGSSVEAGYIGYSGLSVCLSTGGLFTRCYYITVFGAGIPTILKIFSMFGSGGAAAKKPE